MLRSADVARIAAGGGIALQPIGAVEQHGPHLPVETDALIAEALAGGAARKLAPSLPTWLLPVLSYGLSPEHAGWPGTVSLSVDTMLGICRDLAVAVADSGIGTLIFINAHGGNPDLLRVACREIHSATGVRAYVVHAPTLGLSDDLLAQMPRPELDVHAGFYETSVMLALHPDAVSVRDARPDGLAVADALAGYRHISLFGEVSLPWSTADLSGSGTIGDPTGATAEWGRSALEVQTTALAATIEELAAFRYPAIARDAE